jgi:hypothetical protein
MSDTITPVKITKQLSENIINYALAIQRMQTTTINFRSVMEDMDRAYMRENDWTQAQRLARNMNARGDADKIQNITVPIVMPQVETALGYFTEVFLTGNPIFAVNSTPDNEVAAKQVEAVVAENGRSANWARHMMMAFRDGLKYNLMALECQWEQYTFPGIQTDINFPNSARPKTVQWQGNKIRRLDLYNTFFDLRCDPSELYAVGEFAGYNQLFSRTRMKQYLNARTNVLAPHVITDAMESTFTGPNASTSGSAPFSYYVPLINPRPLVEVARRNLNDFNWMAWSTNTNNAINPVNYANMYVMTRFYARIIPSDFGMLVPEANTPQVWSFIVVNGKVVIEAQRLSNIHGWIPIFFGQPIEDGLTFQTKGFASNVQDLQSVASALWNGVLASKRRLVGDRVLYDPLRVRPADINSTAPAAKIPVTPSAMGGRVSDAVFQFPFHDEPTNSLQAASQAVVNFANMASGQNPAQQGQFVKGNKTLHEYDDVMGHGNNRNVMMAIATEQQVMGPIKQVILWNILQYQQNTTLQHPQTNAPVQVNVDTIRQTALAFQVSDGLTPTDKLMNVDDWMTALQVIGSSPQIGQGYNVAPMFSYLMNMRGADLTPFEKPPEQIQYEQALGAWQQAAAQAAKVSAPFNTPMPKQPAPPQPAGAPAPTQAAQQTSTP